MFRSIECSQSDNIKILCRDVRHASRETILRGLFGTGGLCGFGSGGCIGASTTGSKIGATSVSDFFEAPIVEGIIGIIRIKESEFWVVFLLLADTF